jgi:heat-inducible transcriptional repressor
MKDRKKKIFKISVDEYVKSAKPVGSDAICKKYKLGVSPATVRNELLSLEEEGLLYQPHTSAGRVPTNKGFRMFADEIMDEMAGDFNDFFDARGLFDFDRADVGLFEEVADAIAQKSGMLGMAGSFTSGKVARSGMDKLFAQPDFFSHEDFREMGETLEHMEKHFFEVAESLFKDDNSCFKVFVGEENPFGRSGHFSFMVSRCSPKKDKGIMMLMGPKRMQYKKNARLLSGLKHFIEEQ